MMAIRSILLQSVGVLVGALLLSACNRAPAAQESTSTESKPQAAVPQQDPGIRVPLTLALRGPDPAPNSGEITLDLELQATMALRVPVELKVNLPDGVELISGKATESLTISQPGKVQRQLVVRTKSALTKPISVTMDARDPNGAFGLHAERLFPEPAAPAVRANTLRPPMARPPQPPN